MSDTGEGDDDDDDPSALLQSFLSASANVAGQQEADATLESALLSSTTQLDVPDH